MMLLLLMCLEQLLCVYNLHQLLINLFLRKRHNINNRIFFILLLIVFYFNIYRAFWTLESIWMIMFSRLNVLVKMANIFQSIFLWTILGGSISILFNKIRHNILRLLKIDSLRLILLRSRIICYKNVF